MLQLTRVKYEKPSNYRSPYFLIIFAKVQILIHRV